MIYSVVVPTANSRDRSVYAHDSITIGIRCIEGRAPRGHHWLMRTALAIVVTISVAGCGGSSVNPKQVVGYPARASAGATLGATGATQTSAAISTSTPPTAGPGVRVRNVPTSLGSLRLDPASSRRRTEQQLQAGLARSFKVPQSDVFAGAYVKGGETRRFPRGSPLVLMEIADLRGQGSSANALKSFLKTHDVSDPHAVSAGPLGGGAGCGTLTDSSGATVAQCMWSDAGTYASFFAWSMSTQALHRLMLAVRPRIEVRGG
jgi:hypothetical protein